MKWGVPRAEFQSFLAQLGYKQADGQNEKSDGYTWDPPRELTGSELQRLKDQNYQLSDKGRKAFDLIVAAVSEQLK